MRQDRLRSPEVQHFSAGRRVTSALPTNLESGCPWSLEHCSFPAGVGGWASLCAPRERWQAPPPPAARADTRVHTHSQLRQRTCRHAHAPVTQGTRSDPHTHTYTRVHSRSDPHIHTYVHTSTLTLRPTHSQVHTYMSTLTCSDPHAHKYVHSHTLTGTHTKTHTLRPTHSHINTVRPHTDVNPRGHTHAQTHMRTHMHTHMLVCAATPSNTIQMLVC